MSGERLTQHAGWRYGTAVVAMTAGAVLISSSAVWVRAADVAPTVAGVYRMLIGGAVMLALCLARGQPVVPGWRYGLWLAAPAFCFALDLFFWHKSIVLTGPGLAAVLANLQVFMLTAVGVIWLGERLSAAFVAGLVLAAGGVWMLVGVGWQSSAHGFQAGVGFGIATALAYALFLLTLRHTQKLDERLSPMAALALISLLCAFLLVLLALAEGASFVIPNAISGWSMVANGVLCQVIGWLLVTRAIASLPASLVGLILLLEPGLSFVWDLLFFGRVLQSWDLPGLVLVLAGIYLASSWRRIRPASTIQ